MFDPETVAASIKEICRHEATALSTDSMVLCFKNNERAIVHLITSGVQEILAQELPKLEDLSKKSKIQLTTDSFLFNTAVFMEEGKADHDMAMLWAVYWSEYYRREHNLTERPIVLCMDVTAAPMRTNTIDNTLVLSV